MSWFEFIVAVFAMMVVHHLGYQRGFKAGALKQKARSWRRIARAQARVEALGAGPVEKPDDKWELPEREEGSSC